jgi:hypothetical protein
MAHEDDASEPPIRGEAAWKAELSATEQRNTAARQRAHGHQSAAMHATVERERRMAQLESAQLAALNRKLDARGGQYS